MSGRNRGPPLPMKGVSHSGMPPTIHETLYGRGHAPMPHPAMLEDMRESQFGMNPRPLPPHPAIIEERLAAQHQDIQAFLVDNQRLACTHVALKQELEASQHELQHMAHVAESVRAEKEAQARELYDKSVRLEVDLREMEAMRAELRQVHADITDLNGARQEFAAKAHMMTEDLHRITADLQQIPVLRAETEAMNKELQRARAAIEYEKKGYAENFEHGRVMEKKIFSMARELEKLRAEMANAEKRARAAVPVVNQGYTANYGNPEAPAGYMGNHYPVNYGMNPVQVGAENFPPYGVAPAPWGAYDMRSKGHMN